MDALRLPADLHGTASVAEPEVEIRPLRSQEDFQACLALQRLTWGEHFSECVPPTILQVVQRVGGVAAGAFDARGALLGFVFGITGVRDRRLVHWSDMLAVREEARGRGIGRRLKEFQRQALLAEGVEAIYWTYDPLVARNGHFNLNRLGARVVEYVRDMYGEQTSSKLHDGIGTDRFIVAWEIAGAAASAPPPGMPDAAEVRDSPVARGGEGGSSGEAEPPVLRIEVPPSLQTLIEHRPAEARRWREETRAAFQRWLGRGYVVRGLHRDPATGRCFYVLTSPIER